MAFPSREEKNFDGVHCTFSIQKFPGGIVLRIAGTDVGEFGDAPMVELKKHLSDSETVHLFIDAREVRGASINVSGEWAAWLRAHRAHLSGISMLTGSRYVEITADFVRRFAALEGIMRIYTEPAIFDAVLADALLTRE